MQIYRALRKVGLILIVLFCIPLQSGRSQDGPSLCTEEIYPDLCPVKDMLYESYLWFDGGVPYFRFSNGIANLGPWELFFEPAGPVNMQTGKRPARQRVGCVTIDDDTLTKNITVGNFEYHGESCHEHVHLGKIAKYSIRAYSDLSEPPGNTLAFGEKVGFCLVDGAQYQQDECCGPYIGTRPASSVFSACPPDLGASFHEGISVGWQDTYGYWLDDQWIDISAIQSSGQYWLESVADPDKFIRQASKANDTVRIPVFISYKDLYEPNDSKISVDAMALGGAYSSNLRTCQTVVDNLTIHREYPPNASCNTLVEAGDVDYFKIYLPRQGGPNHSVAIRFSDLSGTAFKDGDLDLELRDSNDGLVLGSYSNDDDEVISLDGQPAGTFYIKVYGRAMTEPVANSNYYYRLELTLPACGDVNGDGQITVADYIVLNCCQNAPDYCNGGNVPCLSNAKLDGDCDVDCDDRDILEQYLFYGGQLPANCSCQ